MPLPSRRICLTVGAVVAAVTLGAACSSPGSGPVASSPGSSPGTAPGPVGTAPPMFPGDDWATADPAASGFDPARLEAVAATAERAGSNCMLVVRHGRIVGEWYWHGTTPDTDQEVFSATKSYTSTLVGIAQDQGRLRITDSASTYVGEWKGTPAEAVTIRNLLSNDSGRHYDDVTDYVKMAVAEPDKTTFAIGLPQDNKPGEVWFYNNSAIQTLDRVLRNAVGASPADYAREALLDPIGMRHSRMTKDPAGNTLTFMGLHSTCRDMARYGHLMLNRGRWAGRQIVSSAWVDEATRSSNPINEAYGYLWWLNCRCRTDGAQQATTGSRPAGSGSPRQMVPGAPEDAFFALGLGDQHIEVYPSLDVVLVRLAPVNVGKGAAPFGPADLARVVTEALVAP